MMINRPLRPDKKEEKKKRCQRAGSDKPKSLPQKDIFTLDLSRSNGCDVGKKKKEVLYNTETKLQSGFWMP